MSTSDPQPSTTPTRVVPQGMTRAEFRDFKRRYKKLAKQARCRGVKPAPYKVSVT